MSDLPDAPDTPLDGDGTARHGTYRGQCTSTDLTGAVQRSGTSAGVRFLREKKWQWFAAANPQFACGGTLLDAGYATAVFLWVFDRTAARMIVDETEILPPFAVEIDDNPSSGGGALLRGLRRTFRIDRLAESVTVDASIGSIRLGLEFDTSRTDAMTAICPVGDDANRGVNVTQKQTCLPVRGRVAAAGRAFEFGAGSTAMLDYTHGLLARETSWLWSIASGVLDDGTPIGFNFVRGFNDDLENAVWIGQDLQRASAVSIDFDEQLPEEPWSVRSEDGTIDLSLFVEGIRRHETNFRIVTSKYMQPLGRLHGRIVDREVHDLFGLAERHDARW